MPRSHGSEIDTLIQLLAKLPGLGPRSARRSTLQLLKKKDSVMVPLADALRHVADKIVICDTCGNIDTHNPCHVCEDVRRDRSLVCVVEDVADLWAMERSGVFKGRYHVLGGTLSALDAIGPQELRIPRLVDRIDTESVTEVILALNATIDGQTTAHYIADQLEGRVRLTSLARPTHGVRLPRTLRSAWRASRSPIRT
mgnify:CR=1 FL=1